MRIRPRLVAIVLLVFLEALLSGVSGLAGNSDTQGKDLVGTWEGTFSMDSGAINVGMILRLEDKKIVGELKTPHGSWSVTEARFLEGKWEILVRTPENTNGLLKGVLSGDKLEGSYEFPPSFGGEFKLTRSKGAK